MKTPYNKMYLKLQRFESFEGSSVRAFNTGDLYIVYSYNTQIVKVNIKENTGVYNDTYYSNTTRKIQSLIKDNVLPYLTHLKYKTGLREGAKL